MEAIQENGDSGKQHKEWEQERADWVSDRPFWLNLDDDGSRDYTDGLNHISQDVDDSRPDVQVFLLFHLLWRLLFVVRRGRVLFQHFQRGLLLLYS